MKVLLTALTVATFCPHITCRIFSSLPAFGAGQLKAVNKVDRVFNETNQVAIRQKNMSSQPIPNDRGTQNAGNIILSKFVQAWGILGVVCILGNGIVRMLPIASQPFIQKDLEPYQWGISVAFILFMLYVEGYKSFQLKFSPMVVARAMTLMTNPTFAKILLAGPYCMGLFGATRKRMIVSWSINIGVLGIVVLVKQLPYPWRAIVNMGAVSGLSYGALSTIGIFIASLFGEIPKADPCMPIETVTNKSNECDANASVAETVIEKEKTT